LFAAIALALAAPAFALACSNSFFLVASFVAYSLALFLKYCSAPVKSPYKSALSSALVTL